VTSGKIGISIEQYPSVDRLIDTLSSGDYFGEMNLLDELPRSATAHVLEDSALLSLNKGRLRGLLLINPEIAIGLLRSLSLRLRDAHRRQRVAETGEKENQKCVHAACIRRLLADSLRCYTCQLPVPAASRLTTLTIMHFL
jgi:CRP-like cAMP-binding protein